jgi:repressor LexA
MFSIRGELTQRQAAVLEYLEEFKVDRDTAPTYREIAAHFGFKSTRAAWDHVRALKKKGYLSLYGGRSRGIELLYPARTPTNGAVGVPVLGDIQAGYPADQSERWSGTLAVDRTIVGCHADHRFFALQVHGESMNGRGIYDSDWVIADADASPLEGDIVVAMIDGQNTLKTLARGNDCFYLKAENPAYKDLVPVKNMVVQGVVKALLRRM